MEMMTESEQCNMTLLLILLIHFMMTSWSFGFNMVTCFFLLQVKGIKVRACLTWPLSTNHSVFFLNRFCHKNIYWTDIILRITVYPLSAVIALANNFTELYADKYKLCRLSRKGWVRLQGFLCHLFKYATWTWCLEGTFPIKLK